MFKNLTLRKISSVIAFGVGDCIPMSQETKYILLVDDDEKLLRSLGRRLRGMHPDWELTEAPNAQAALEHLEKNPCELIVTDIQMPVMDGAAFLEIVREKYPKIIRFALSGHAQRDIMLRVVSLSHQYFSKPCDTELLSESITQALENTARIPEKRLREILIHLNQFPLAGPVYSDLLSLLSDASCGADKISEVIGRDPAMASKVLHVANSAFFGAPHKVGALSEAVTLLGTDAIRALAMVFRFLEGLRDENELRPSFEALWEHSIAASSLAALLQARYFQREELLEKSRTLALLHDLGKFIIADFSREKYIVLLKRSLAESIPLSKLEEHTLGISHAEIGALLFELWGLPHDLVQAIRYHHVPRDCPEPNVLLPALHLANVLEHALNPAQGFFPNPLQSDYLEKLKIPAELNFWVGWVNENEPK